MLYVGIGLLVGLVIGIGIAVVRDQLDTTLRTAEDVERGFNEPVLGVLPRSKVLSRAHPDLQGDFRASEALRKLRTNLRFVNIDQELRCIVVTSPLAGEGKSSVASSLARVMALAGQEVLLIDADLRRPTVASTFQVAKEIGLTQVLAGAVPLEDAVASTETTGLHVLPAGETPPNPSELLGSQRMKDLLEFLRSWYFVIVDAPPLLPVTDGALLAKNSDGALVVAAARKTGTEQLHRAISNVEQVQGHVLGIVLNGVASGRFSRLKYGDPEYGYGLHYDRYGEYRATEAKKSSQPGSGPNGDEPRHFDEHIDVVGSSASINGSHPDTSTRMEASLRRGSHSA
nr:CpsD/CapB family tyrosine-protein kinase [Brooklawnia cerclae]